MASEQDVVLLNEENQQIRRGICLPRVRKGMSQRISVATLGSRLVALSYVGFCVAEMLLSIEDDRSQWVKMGSFGLLGVAVALRPRFHKLVLLIAPLIAVFAIALSRSFNFYAGADELQRFLFPLPITISLYAYRDRLKSIASVFLAVVVTNDIFQCYFYLAYVFGLPLLVPVRVDSGLYLRAQGWVGFFSEFGFMNFCALLLYTLSDDKVRSKFGRGLLAFFALSSFSFKLMIVLAMYPLVFGRGRARTYLLLLMGGLLAGVATALGLLDRFIGLAVSKISFYIIAGNSARAESYRVMWESLTHGNLLGEGLGSFGGPASVKYGSPLYAHYRFNWYGLQDVLKTTDTFYPHLFVELGLVGGSLWLYIVMFYGQRNIRTCAWIFVAAAFLFDNIFSLSITSPSYVFPALLVMYRLSSQASRKAGAPQRS
jgi:hypothetical protein